MCDPISLTVAAAAVTMGGQYIQGQSAYTAAKYKEAAANANAGYASQQAKDSLVLTENEAARRYREAGQLEGKQTAAMAANGIDLNYGSAVDVLRDSKMIAAEDVGNIYQGGQNRTMGYLIDAYNYRTGAAAAHSEAKMAPIATGFAMLGTALGAASQVSKMKSGQNFGG